MKKLFLFLLFSFSFLPVKAQFFSLTQLIKFHLETNIYNIQQSIKSKGFTEMFPKNKKDRKEYRSVLETKKNKYEIIKTVFPDSAANNMLSYYLTDSIEFKNIKDSVDKSYKFIRLMDTAPDDNGKQFSLYANEKYYILLASVESEEKPIRYYFRIATNNTYYSKILLNKE